MNKKIFLLLSVVVLIVACTSQLPTFGLDAIVVNTETSIEGERNVLVIKDKLTIPRSPVLTDQSVQFSFILENKDVEKKASSVQIDLFDAPLMKNTRKELCNQATGSKCAPNEPLNDILPGEQKQITFDLFSPSQGQIGGLKTDLKMNFKVTYNFEGSTSFTVPVINVDEVKARQRAGDKIRVDIVKSIGSGSIQVDPELFGSSYILSGQSGTFFFVIKNKGSGNLPLSQVPKEKLCIYFPKEFFDASTELVSPDGKSYDSSGNEVTKSPTGGVTGLSIGKYIDDIATKPVPITGMQVDQGGTGCDCLLEQDAGGFSWRCSAGCGSRTGASCDIGPSACLETTQPSQETQGETGTYVKCYDTRTGGSLCLPKSGNEANPYCDFSVEYPDSTCAGSSQPSQGPLFTCVNVESAGDVDCNAGNKEPNKILCYNVRAIDLFRDESRVSMRFSLHKTAKIDDPFRSMTILSKIKYPYELRDSFEITAIPAKE